MTEKIYLTCLGVVSLIFLAAVVLKMVVEMFRGTFW
jgi:hypothetical protein